MLINVRTENKRLVDELAEEQKKEKLQDECCTKQTLMTKLRAEVEELTL